MTKSTSRSSFAPTRSTTIPSLSLVGPHEHQYSVFFLLPYQCFSVVTLLANFSPPVGEYFDDLACQLWTPPDWSMPCLMPLAMRSVGAEPSQPIKRPPYSLGRGA